MMFEINQNYSINLNKVESVTYNPDIRCIHIKMINNNYHLIKDVSNYHYSALINHINEVIS